jgi:hypothetical protein
MIFWTSVGGLVLLLACGGYFAYGASGAISVLGAAFLILLATWVYRTL